MIAVISSKGQVTIPVDVRRRLGLHAGCRVDFVFAADDRLELIPVADTVRRLKGMVPKPKRPLGLDEMNQAIAEGAQR